MQNYYIFFNQQTFWQFFYLYRSFYVTFYHLVLPYTTIYNILPIHDNILLADKPFAVIYLLFRLQLPCAPYLDEGEAYTLRMDHPVQVVHTEALDILILVGSLKECRHFPVSPGHIRAILASLMLAARASFEVHLQEKCS